MIRKSYLSSHYVVAGGLTVYFDSVSWDENFVGSVKMFCEGVFVCSVSPADKGGKARIAELKKLGLLKGESGLML